MNLDGIEDLIELVPQHYGEAVQLYPWIKNTNCNDYEWCNRTTIENAVWLIKHLNEIVTL